METRPRRRLSPHAWLERQQVGRVAALFRAGRLRSEIGQELGMSALKAGELVRYAERLGLIQSAAVVRVAPKARACMCCGVRFTPGHRFNRLCDVCRTHATGLPRGWV